MAPPPPSLYSQSRFTWLIRACLLVCVGAHHKQATGEPRASGPIGERTASERPAQPSSAGQPPRSSATRQTAEQPVAATPVQPVLGAGEADYAVDNQTGDPAGVVDGAIEPPQTELSDAPYEVLFERARQALIDNRDEEALEQFEALSRVAPTPADRRIADEFASLARDRITLREQAALKPEIRTTDELSVLYTTAFTYGVGTSTWFALQVKPSSFPTALLPFVAITAASIGGVAIADGYRPFRLGVPMSISAGAILGTMEGVWISAYQSAVAERRDTDKWGAPTVATALWAGASAGGLIGGIVGALRQPTPGQVSFTTSGALWGGILSSLLAAASESQTEYRAERAFALGGLGYNAGLIAAFIASPHQMPSVARVRLVDLGGLAGGLLGAGGYVLMAGDEPSPRATMGAASIGALIGLGLSWWATDGMPEQRYPQAEVSPLSRVRPAVVPVRQGAIGVLELTL